MHKMLTDERISNVLFEADPMRTCCKENDCFDEYDSVALSIFEKISSGQPVSEAISQAFVDWFEVESIDPAALGSIVQALQTENHG